MMELLPALDELPRDILIAIFLELPLKDLKNMGVGLKNKKFLQLFKELIKKNYQNIYENISQKNNDEKHDSFLEKLPPNTDKNKVKQNIAQKFFFTQLDAVDGLQKVALTPAQAKINFIFKDGLSFNLIKWAHHHRALKVLTYIFDLSQENLDPESYWTSLHWAAACDQSQLLEQMPAGTFVSDITDFNPGKFTPFSIAVRYGNLNFLKAAMHKINASGLREEFYIDHTENPGDYTPLHFAILKKQISVIAFLLEHGSHAFMVQVEESPFYFAMVENSAPEIIQLLIKYIPKDLSFIKQGYEDGNALFHKAIRLGCLEGFRSLLLVDPNNINLQDKIGDSLLHYAVICKQPDILIFLIQQKANIEIKNMSGRTPLVSAVFKRDIKSVQILLEANAQVNTQDIFGTPLHLATKNGDADIVELLLTWGAQPNIKNVEGDFPLHIATKNAHLKIIKLLREKGADIHLPNLQGKTPIQLAMAMDERNPDVLLALNPGWSQDSFPAQKRKAENTPDSKRSKKNDDDVTDVMEEPENSDSTSLSLSI